MPDVVSRASSGLADLVDYKQISALMTARSSTLLDSNSALVDQILRGVTAEVTALVGRHFAHNANPDSLDLAIWAITLGVAANIELSLFPEQQIGDDSRANILRTQYLAVRSDLASSVSGTDTGSSIDGAFTIRGRGRSVVCDARW